MPAGTLEERITQLESRQDALQRLIEEQLPGRTAGQKRGWKSIVGTFEDDPLYEEAMRLGREWRESERDENVSDTR